MAWITRDDVLKRLLVAKQLLAPARGQLTPNSDAVVVAEAVLRAHDAAELALAAIADELRIPGLTGRLYLMNYVELVEKHTNKPLPGATFLRRFNMARDGFKHHGNVPATREWYGVVDQTWSYFDDWCHAYLDLSLDSIDLMALLSDSRVKELCGEAKQLHREERYKEALEHLGMALYYVLESCPGIRAPGLNEPNIHDALTLSAYGVRPSEFLSLQEFLPKVRKDPSKKKLKVSWDTRKTGHPGNWTGRNIAFCLEAVVDVALKTQYAPWHPNPVEFYWVYDDVITAKRDQVVLWRKEPVEGFPFFLESEEKVEVMRLNRGQSLRGMIVVPREKPGGLAQALGPEATVETVETLGIMSEEIQGFAYVARDDVEISYAPKENEIVRRLFPHIFGGR